VNERMDEWQPYACHTSDCRAGYWLVRASHAQPELWHVASMTDGVPWLVAAAEPACPFCGTALAAAGAMRDEGVAAQRAA
jgi:hypothetical protein